MLYVCWGLLGILYLIDGINMLRGKGRWMKRLNNKLEGRNLTVFRRVQGCLYLGFSVCFICAGASIRIPVNSTHLGSIMVVLFIIMLAANKKYTGSFFGF